ncbi:hypothetical protein [Bacteroides thetaiotaomicron]|jgi:hypothetical protein|uniref:hypothetical protein n=1 Tax=Bacteroides thetaiotaomicron TaxID=818 RepID=UPI00232A8D7F|nr:hypothetical protein [Bacteroides thetaiotaomicron]MDC2179163.1 hypothetical protein [Bacteroides thetaiotaomicron]
MKKVFYESWIAKHLLINNCTTITLLAWVFTKWSKMEARQSTINHECVHARQWIELTVASGILLWIGMLVFGYSAWWLTLSAATFYVWYVLEWCIRKMIASVLADCREDYDAYRLISFEREARLAEKDNNYLENCSYFSGWLRYVFK